MSQPSLQSHRGTVLVVEDESSLNFLACQILERQGFRVVSACDGQQGVEAFTRSAQEIVLVLLDQSMPNKDGLEALREIKRLRRDVPVLLMSGFSEEDMALRFQGEDVSAFLSKPFAPTQLMEKVEQVLGVKLLAEKRS